MRRRTNPQIQTVLFGVAAALLGSAIASPALGEEGVLTLERALEIAAAGNLQLEAADARLGVAAAGVDEARAARRPHLELGALAQRTEDPVMVFSNLLSQGEFREENFAVDTLNDPDPLSNWKTRLAVTQPLWTAGRIAHGVAAAEHRAQAGEGERDAIRQRVAHGVIEAYTGAVLAERELEVARRAVTTSRAHLELVRDLWRSGLVVESDALQAEVRESEVRELEILAESAVEVSRAVLNLAMGRPLEIPIQLPEDLELDLSAGVGSPGEVEGALDRRPDLRAAQELAAAAGRRVAAERAGRWPEIGLEGSWQANAEDFFGADGEHWTVTIGLELDVFDGGRRRARVRRAEQEQLEAAARAAYLAETIGLEVRRAGSRLAAASERLEQARRGVRLAERGLEIVKDRYREGLTVLTELLDAEDALTRARLRQVAARRDVLLARAGLDLATGRL